MRSYWNTPFPLSKWPLVKSTSGQLWLPKNQGAPEPHEMRHIPGIVQGATYQSGVVSEHPIGKYVDPSGSHWFVKHDDDNIMYKPDFYKDIHEMDWKGPSPGLEFLPNRRSPKFIEKDKGALARQEFTAHALYGVFATPKNGIGVVPAKILSGKTRTEIPDDFHQKEEHDPDHELYLATKHVGDSHPHYRYRGTKEDADLDRLRHRGAIVDALLRLQDTHSGNFRIDNINGPDPKMYRIDTGECLGNQSAGSQTLFMGNPKSVQKWKFLPELAELGNIIHYVRTHGTHPTISGYDLLEQADEVIHTWETKQDEIKHALRHSYNPDVVYMQLAARIQALRNMVKTYDPVELEHELMSFQGYGQTPPEI